MTKFKTNKEMMLFIEECLDETCMKIQSVFNNQDGGIAGHYWSGETRRAYFALVGNYILTEMAFYVEEQTKYMEDDLDQIKSDFREATDVVEF